MPIIERVPFRILGMLIVLVITTTFFVFPQKVTIAASSQDKVIQQAINFVNSKSNTNGYYSGWCLQFVNDVYAKAGFPVKRFTYAIDALNAHAKAKKLTSEASPGALMFWDQNIGDTSGHVAIYIGNGQAITSKTVGTPNKLAIVSANSITKLRGFRGYVKFSDVIR